MYPRTYLFLSRSNSDTTARFRDQHSPRLFTDLFQVFDITRKGTYQNLALWHKELEDYSKGIPTIVVANKIDCTSMAEFNSCGPVCLILMQSPYANPCVVQMLAVDYKVTEKAFAFATKRNVRAWRRLCCGARSVLSQEPYLDRLSCPTQLPLFFCSAADGTNVVQVFEEAIKLAMKFKLNPPDNYESDVLATLDYFNAKVGQLCTSVQNLSASSKCTPCLARA